MCESKSAEKEAKKFKIVRWKGSVLQQEVPIDACLWQLSGTTKHSLQRLFLGILWRARLYVPHAKRYASACANHDLVLVKNFVIIGAITEAHVLHYSIDESC